jgi:type IV secretion system protein VirB10
MKGLFKKKEAKANLDLAGAPDPDILTPPPKGGAGTKTLNNLPLIIGGGVLCGLVWMAMSAADHREQARAERNSKGEEVQIQEVSRQPDFLDYQQAAGVIPATSGHDVEHPEGLTPEEAAGIAPAGPQPGQNVQLAGGQGQPGAAPALVNPYEEDWIQRANMVRQMRAERFSAIRASYAAPTQVQAQSAGGHAASDASASPTAALASALRAAAGATPQFPQMPQMPAGVGGAGEGSDPNNQAAKRAFASAAGKDPAYLDARREAPKGALELKAGSVINVTLNSGINSDLPGIVTGMVTRNVFDSVSGASVLIPQGTKVIGLYNSQVSIGQARVQVVWKRLIFPDGSSIDLGGMPAADASGYAGLNDKVNNHYAKAFGSALFVSLFSAGVQLSQPQATNGQNVSNAQVAAAALGQQTAQLGMQMASRTLTVQPTLEIRPGKQVLVQLTKDVILPAWKGR